MELDPNACYRAVRARDHRFDGRFYVGITSTHIYCRPIRRARAEHRKNMRFYSNAAAAEGAGFRPCLRCRPERAPGMGPVDAVSRLVGAAMAGIEEHALSSAHVGDLAASLGVSDRHLRRVTEAELGVSPIELAQTQRLLLAKRLLRETSLDLTDIAFASGFGSVRRFNALFKSRYGLSPRAIPGKSIDNHSLSGQLGFELAVRTVLGQQVSVKGASTISGRWAQAYGEPIATPWPELNRLSPGADRMAGTAPAEVAALGIIGARARSLVGLAQAILQRKIVLAY